MRDQIGTIDYDKITEQIEDLLKSYGLSFRDFLNHMDLDVTMKSEDRDCCSKVYVEDCCPEVEQVLDNIDEFDWEV